MTPQAGQYLGVYPERLMQVSIQTSGPFIFANVDPTLGRDISPPTVASEVAGEAVRIGGQWQEHHVNWKLAGAALVDTARSHPDGGGASNYISAEWYFPNLVVIKARRATLAIVLQPTAFDQTLWRLSFFRGQQVKDASYDCANRNLISLVELAAAKALSHQADAEMTSVCDVTEQSRSAWKFNQELLRRINEHHAAYWNAPLTDARLGR
jgi:hypothetical protein